MVSTDDAMWIQSTFETVSLMLAVIAGIWEASLFKDNMLLLFEIEAAISAPVVVALIILAKYRKGPAFIFAKLLLKGLTWVTALLAGNLFTTGYGYVFSFPWPQGILWFVVYVLIVAVIIHAIKERERRLDIRKKEWKKALMPSFL
jgi:multisubunit Na+/H+ antiporter MnhG subunit